MIRIKQAVFSLLSLVALITIAGENTWAAEKSAKLATVRIGYVSRSILDMPYIIARDRGLFREEGLEPELIFIKAAQTVPAMLAGRDRFRHSDRNRSRRRGKRCRRQDRVCINRQAVLRPDRRAEYHQRATTTRQKARHYGIRGLGRNPGSPDSARTQDACGSSYFSSYGNERRDLSPL